MSMTRPADVESLLAHRAWVRTLSRAIVADPGRADDVEQAAWLTALTSPPRDVRGIRGWFASVVRSRALDAARESRRRTAREELAARRGAEPSAADVAARFDAERRVAAGVQALPEPLRTTVLLRFYEGLSVRATARRMGVPYETARARLHSALGRLRESLAEPEGRHLGAAFLLASSPGGLAMASSKKSVVAAVLVLALLGGAIWFLTTLTGGGAPEIATVPEAASSARTTARPAARPAVRGGRARAGEPAQTVPEVPTTSPVPGTDVASAGDVTSGAPTPDEGAAPVEPAAKPGVAPPDASSPAKPEPPIQLKGRVLDAETGEPIEGVRVLYAVVVDGVRQQNWQGDTTGSDGVFTNTRPRGWDVPGARLELRLGKDGYETERLPVTEAEPRVALRRRTHAPLPGRVAGLVRDADGRPLTGIVEVDGYDEMGGNCSQYAIADAGGSFVLEGMPAGSWTLTVGDSAASEVVVPEAAETRVDLRSSADGVVRSASEWAREVAVLSGSQSDFFGDEAAKRRAAEHPVREVVVTGLPHVAGAVVRGEFKPRLVVRADAKDGEARFAAFPVGRWTFALVRPGEPSRSMQVDVVPGDGPQRVAFPAK